VELDHTNRQKTNSQFPTLCIDMIPHILRLIIPLTHKTVPSYTVNRHWVIFNRTLWG